MSLIGRVGWVKTQICTMSLFSVFFFELFPNSHLMEISMKLLVKRDTKVVVKTSITEMLEGNICLLFLPLLLLTFCEYDAMQEEGQKTLWSIICTWQLSPALFWQYNGQGQDVVDATDAAPESKHVHKISFWQHNFLALWQILVNHKK